MFKKILKISLLLFILLKFVWIYAYQIEKIENIDFTIPFECQYYKIINNANNLIEIENLDTDVLCLYNWFWIDKKSCSNSNPFSYELDYNDYSFSVWDVIWICKNWLKVDNLDDNIKIYPLKENYTRWEKINIDFRYLWNYDNTYFTWELLLKSWTWTEEKINIQDRINKFEFQVFWDIEINYNSNLVYLKNIVFDDEKIILDSVNWLLLDKNYKEWLYNYKISELWYYPDKLFNYSNNILDINNIYNLYWKIDKIIFYKYKGDKLVDNLEVDLNEYYNSIIEEVKEDLSNLDLDKFEEKLKNFYDIQEKSNTWSFYQNNLKVEQSFFEMKKGENKSNLTLIFSSLLFILWLFLLIISFILYKRKK